MGRISSPLNATPGEYSHRSSEVNVLVVYRLPANMAAQNPQD